ncbi:carbohydrate porin [Humitalea sp. 24SJ18S-53]|uniref:carbohydrate porin n=1 Tax=Humitalea sp. 24SJ18S-53 TaxID=3422307 RepID=UPI003D67ED6E
MPKNFATPARGPTGLAAAAAFVLATLPALAQQAPEAARAAEASCEQGRSLGHGLCGWAELTVDAFGNVTGGVRRGAAADGQVWIGLNADLGALLGWDGWSAEVSAYGIYGRQPTATLVGSQAAVSNIEALTTARLNELWLQRRVEGLGSIRFGQLALDTEFSVAAAAGNLISGTFGWPVALASALPAGGAAYPLPAPGVRLALGDPDGGTGVRAALTAGNPAGQYAPTTNPQAHNRYGTNFSTSGGAFGIIEGVTGAAAPEGSDGPRPWVAKLGAWYHNAGFDSQRYDSIGLSLADPDSNGTPKRYGNNYGGYGIVEAVAWRGEDANVNLFGRVYAAPPDTNLIALQVDAGLAWTGPFGRAADVLSLGVSQARVGSVARGLDRDMQSFGQDRFLRTHETIIELNYNLSVVPDRFSVQPVVQWLMNPAAREPDERVSTVQPLGDAALIGVRLSLVF